ncbi:MAG: FtsX-like permease family protein [Rhodobacteraceae bacterium]|nr:FtsX-like permease family protein [Paracoccaceae bacterium]
MLLEALRQAVQAILRNMLRSFLTVLGIVIGVAAVIAMLTVGQGSTTQVKSDVAKLGNNLLIVRPGQGGGPGVSAGTAPSLSERDAAAIEAEVPAVSTAAPLSAGSMAVVFGNQNHTTNVTGTDNRYLAATGWTMAKGRDFYDSDILSGAAVCILGETVRQALFGAGDPIGADIRFRQVSCRVVGLLAPKGASSFGTDQDDLVLMPLRAFQRRIAGNQEVATIFASVRDGQTTDKAKAAIEALMRERRHIGPGENDDFNVFDLKQIATMLTGISTVLTGLLSAVAGVSLLVGGIGIMNIMLVSVTERTREIGIRLAIGATEAQVLVQFLVEAVVLSLAGGVIGILTGLALGFTGSRILHVPFSPDPWVMLLAFGFSAAVGVIFGFFPARRAARLDPIEALRHQ